KVIGHLEETDLQGNGNAVYCTTVEEVDFYGNENLVEYTSGKAPEMDEYGSKNQLRRVKP
ncbi:MAG: DUF3060 domain-containing protein, partial [Vulcanimicrobiota bacterium]